MRLPPQLTIVLLVIGLVLSALGPDYRLWSVIFAVPFMFAGFALVHGLAATKQLNSNWLTVFYIGWLLFDPIKALLLIVAIVDSWLHIRGRVAKSQPPE